MLSIFNSCFLIMTFQRTNPRKDRYVFPLEEGEDIISGLIVTILAPGSPPDSDCTK